MTAPCDTGCQQHAEMFGGLEVERDERVDFTAQATLTAAVTDTLEADPLVLGISMTQ